ncbi:chaperone protein dnaJ C76, chloroplastic-like [Malania oleifera]|uniref:chaperone protein dnaJ C76, chloroplastic-like n=1 Tax=Malania oleifera TaxID=397392 RepID=UPI0025AE8078|nr:chaperone protein dnaJ C76, chloroplastic-like [Malania oleifera]
MSATAASIHPFTLPKPPQTHFPLGHTKPISSVRPFSRGRKKAAVRRCNQSSAGETSRTQKNYYKLLGVSVNSNSQKIKEAYRKLQKKYHPDIAGQRGHEHTLMLNEAYRVLMREDLRREYDASIGQTGAAFGKGSPGMAGSSWKGPLRPHALFVDENACIGCRQCVHHASNTFVMDDALGCARVKVQYGDDFPKIEVSVESCPVNCIHWVDGEELPVLEFLVQPQPKEGYGVFGGGWERPSNVFAAAKSFNKQLKQQAQRHKRNVGVTVEEESPAQAKARENASMQLRMDRFSKLWNWVKEISGPKRWNRE